MKTLHNKNKLENVITKFLTHEGVWCKVKKNIRLKHQRNKDKYEVSISLQRQARRVSKKISNTLFYQAYAL